MQGTGGGAAAPVSAAATDGGVGTQASADALRPTALELGGKGAMVVFDDADVDAVAAAAGSHEALEITRDGVRVLRARERPPAPRPALESFDDYS